MQLLHSSFVSKIDEHASEASARERAPSLLAPVVEKMDSTIQWINHYPVDKYLENQLHYPVDRDLSGG